MNHEIPVESLFTKRFPERLSRPDEAPASPDGRVLNNETPANRCSIVVHGPFLAKKNPAGF